MKGNFVFMLLLTSLCSNTQVQLSGNSAVCSSDVAVFKCTDPGSSVLSWILETIDNMQLQARFTSSDPERFILSETLNTSPLTFNIISVNSTFICGTLTIIRPLLLKGTTINCGGEAIKLTVRPISSSSNFISTQLSLMPIEINRFTMTWRSVSQVSRSGFLVTISPSPPHGPDEIATVNSSTEITLANSTKYNITVSPRDCSDNISSTFMFGRCPLLLITPALSVLQYNIDISGVLSVLIRCNIEYGNESHLIECGMNGEWNSDIGGLCNSQDTETENIQIFTIERTSQKYFTLYSKEDQLLPQVSLSVIVFVLVIISSVIGSCLIAFIIFGVILGLFCGVQYSPRNVNTSITEQQSPTAQNTSVQLYRGPLYEEVELEDKTATIDLSQNIAYGCVSKT